MPGYPTYGQMEGTPDHSLIGLLRAITKELAKVKLNQWQVPADTPEEELEKSIFTQYITDVRVLLGRSQTYFGNLSQQATLVGFNLKQKLQD